MKPCKFIFFIYKIYFLVWTCLHHILNNNYMILLNKKEKKILISLSENNIKTIQKYKLLINTLSIEK